MEAKGRTCEAIQIDVVDEPKESYTGARQTEVCVQLAPPGRMYYVLLCACVTYT